MISGGAEDLQSAKGVQAFWDQFFFIQGEDKLSGLIRERRFLPSPHHHFKNENSIVPGGGVGSKHQVSGLHNSIDPAWYTRAGCSKSKPKPSYRGFIWWYLSCAVQSQLDAPAPAE
jgi:hypothetical protein